MSNEDCFTSVSSARGGGAVKKANHRMKQNGMFTAATDYNERIGHCIGLGNTEQMFQAFQKYAINIFTKCNFSVFLGSVMCELRFVELNQVKIITN